jgi:hypothetical protein
MGRKQKYRRFTGRKCAYATEAVEIAKEKTRTLNRKKTGAENREEQERKQEEQGQLTGRSLLVSGGHIGWVEPSDLAFGKPNDRLRETHRLNPPGRFADAFPPAFAGVNPSLRRVKSKPRPKRWPPDARMSLCTYCHAPLVPEGQAAFNLSPLFSSE